MVDADVQMEEAPMHVTVGMKVQVSQRGIWYRAVVLEVAQMPSGVQAKVHYHGWNRRQDEWVNVAEGRIRPPEAKMRSPRQNASTLAHDAALRLSTTYSAAGPAALAGAAGAAAVDAALAQHAGGAVGGKAKAPALPEGWATAAAAETLREWDGKKFYATDWFHAFSAHAITKKAGEQPEKLLPLFVVAVNDLQMLGLCTASKRPRGTIEKRVFG